MSAEWTLTGGPELVAKLREMVATEHLRPVVEEAARLLLAEAKRLAPRDTGELESAIVVVEVTLGDKVISLGVGVPEGDPAWERGMATEYGTRAIIVGTPESPRVSWTAKSKGSASMPWLRAAMMNVAPQVERLFQQALSPHGESAGATA